MPNWRRAVIPGGTYFFTLVTNQRRPIFSDVASRELLGNIMRECRSSYPFEVVAMVLLPDHLHAIWNMPRGDAAYSKRWQWIKTRFTKRWLDQGGEETVVSTGRKRDGRRGVWQPKFWEHTIQDENEFDIYFDYIHFNPVRHGYCKCPRDWRASSFHRWVRKGVYPEDWACGTNGRRPDFKTIEKLVGE